MDHRTIGRTHNFDDLGERVRARRKDLGLSLRGASAEIGVSFNTLGRVERGHLPDLENFRRITGWLGDADIEPEARSTTEAIATHLRTDPLLPPGAADRIAAIVRDLYAALAQPPVDVPVHLRAAKTFSPDASRLLGDLLERMHRRLQDEEA
jgi:transcriptional regulator with XRE-family HTH domain